MNRRKLYRDSHTSPGHGVKYDHELYSEGKYDACVWKIEQEVLDQILDQYYPKGIEKYLDYATGTGRIFGVVAAHSKYAIGIDISEEMINVGRQKYPDLNFIQGDVTRKRDLLSSGPFDCMTCFRFFLNAETQLKAEVLDSLLPGLTRNGYLICNNHGNHNSLLRFVLIVRGWLGLHVQKSLSYSDLKRQLKDNGLSIVEVRAVCFLPRFLYTLLPMSVFLSIEKVLRRLFRDGQFAIYQIIVVKKY